MMRWNAAIAGALSAVLISTGCDNKSKQPISQVPEPVPDSLALLAPIDSNPSTLSPGVASDPLPYDDASFDEAFTFTPPPVRTAGSPRTHIVQPGDTLYALAKRYYQSGREWPRIQQANQARIGDPTRLPIGTRLIIP